MINEEFYFRKLPFFTIILVIVNLACSPTKKNSADYIYFNSGKDTVLTQMKQTLIQRYDMLSINVYSRTLNQEQAAIFNIPSNGSSSTGSQGYQVNAAGNVDMPVIGAVKAAGFTKEDFQSELMVRLSNFVKNPSVSVRFLQFHVNVMGEVRTPGTQKFSVDRVTIIDALAAAGDLTDFGRRDNVSVIREESGQKIYYNIDLRRKDVFQSPVYVLQPNDIVYVSPTNRKLKTLDIDPDSQRRSSLIITIASLVLTTATLIITALR